MIEMAAAAEIVHLAVAPLAKLDDEIVSNVAAIIGKITYETRLRLTGKIPKIIANFDNVQAAELAAKNLRELGLTAIVAYDSELRRPPKIFRARSLKIEEETITFYDRAGQSRRVEDEEVFLIISVRNRTYKEEVVVTSKRKINITATLLTGGIPITKKVEEKKKNISYQTESFSRLYGKPTVEPVVEIVQDNLDYSFLGSEMGSSGATNYQIAIKKIRDAFPHAIFDDGLIEPLGANMPAAMTRDAVEANCKLIYWYHLAAKS